jgi:hypothetical protein
MKPLKSTLRNRNLIATAKQHHQKPAAGDTEPSAEAPDARGNFGVEEIFRAKLTLGSVAAAKGFSLKGCQIVAGGHSVAQTTGQ